MIIGEANPRVEDFYEAMFNNILTPMEPGDKTFGSPFSVDAFVQKLIEEDPDFYEKFVLDRDFAKKAYMANVVAVIREQAANGAVPNDWVAAAYDLEQQMGAKGEKPDVPYDMTRSAEVSAT